MEKLQPEEYYSLSVPSEFGTLNFSGTNQGIFGIEFGLPRSANTSEIFILHVKAALGHLQGKNHAQPSIILNGTALQIRVWQELMRTQIGDTLSYSELAHRIDKPNAVRAVANAVAGNHIALIVPCHRVILKNGHIGEYRWGTDLKKHILHNEHFEKTILREKFTYLLEKSHSIP